MLDLYGTEKTPQFFLPPLPIEYMTELSGRTDAPKVRCDLIKTHTHTDTVTLLRMCGRLIKLTNWDTLKEDRAGTSLKNDSPSGVASAATSGS